MSQPSLTLDPPSSPPLLATIAPIQARKSFATISDSLSSDPLFSDDISDDASVPRSLKRAFRAPWFELPYHKPTKRPRRELSRFIDSGVFLASDSSQDMDRQEASNVVASPRRKVIRQDIVTKIISYCIENNREAIDLSAQKLEYLSPDALRLLHQHVLSQKVDQERSMVPNLVLLLANNVLKDLPSELWNIHNITTLSLRSNQLTEIPENIARLGRLTELNVSGNRICFLPWSLMFLGDRAPLTLMNIRPNPLYTPIDQVLLASQPLVTLSPTSSAWQLATRLEACVTLPQASLSQQNLYDYILLKVVSTLLARDASANDDVFLAPIYAASSSVTFFDVCGRSIADASAQPTAAVLPGINIPLRDITNQDSKTTSLLDIALRSASSSTHVRNMPVGAFDSLELPEMALNHLKSALMIDKTELPRCSVCERHYMIKRAEWIEWWCVKPRVINTAPQNLFTPYMRRACSRGCALEVIKDRAEQHLQFISSRARNMDP